MPRNNRNSMRRKVSNPQVGVEPGIVTAASAPAIQVRKTVTEALIEGMYDPSKFLEYFLDISPYEGQIDFLREVRDCTEANFVAGNRVGKTWIAGALLLWKAFYRHTSPFTEPEKLSPHNDYKALSTSLTLEQAKLAWTYALTFATQSKRFKPFYVDHIYSPHPTMYLRTKNDKGDWVPAEIWARSLAHNGQYLLGQSLNFVLVDECAYVKGYPTIEDEVIRMRLADTGGSLFRFSTPNGRNFFYDYWLKGLPGKDGKRDPRYFSKRLTSWDNPYVVREYLEEQKERMAPEFYAQNVMGDFVSLSDFFKIEQLQALYDIDDAYNLNVSARRTGVYAMGVDLGATRDATIIYVFDTSKQPAELVYAQTLRNKSWRASREAVVGAYSLYNPAKTWIDSTGVGAPIVQQLIEEDGLQNVNPFVFTSGSKPALLALLQDAVQRRAFIFPYGQETKPLVQQMSFYRLDDKGIEQDAVMAIALAWGAVDAIRRGQMVDTDIDDDLQVVGVSPGQGPLDEDFLFGAAEIREAGRVFDLDQRSGLFVPRNEPQGGFSRWGF